MELSYLLDRIHEAIHENEDVHIGIRVYNGDIYYGILFRELLIDPVYIGVTPDNFLDELHDAITKEFEGIIIPVTTHTTGRNYTYTLTIDNIFIEFPKDDIDWIINRMHKNENNEFGSR